MWDIHVKISDVLIYAWMTDDKDDERIGLQVHKGMLQTKATYIINAV